LIIYAVVNKEELDWNEEKDIWTYECRCGDLFSISKDDLADLGTVPSNAVVIACQGCSLGLEITVS
jgi:hypothetical protein